MNSKSININTKSPYEVVIGDGILEGEIQKVTSLCDGKKFCIVTDSGVPKEIIERVKNALNRGKNEVFCYSFPCGEESKNTTTLFEILSFLKENPF